MTESIECPRCGTEIAPEGDMLPDVCPECGEDLEQERPARPFDAPVDYQLFEPPADSRIEIIEAANDRLMLSIPGGGKGANALGCFGAAWLSITALITFLVGFAGMKEQNIEGNVWMPVLLMGIFWLIGLVMVGFAVRIKYTRGYLFLSKDRAVHQRILLGRKKNSEVALDASSYAHLVESYQENDNPVYRIEIRGAEGKIGYGTGLDAGYKLWYVETINRFIAHQYETANGGSSAASIQDPYRDDTQAPTCPACGQLIEDDDDDRCTHCGASLVQSAGGVVTAQITDEISPDSLPEGFPVYVRRTKEGEWRFSYALRAMTADLKSLGCLMVVGLIWEAIVLVFTGAILHTEGGTRGLLLFITVPFHLIGAGLLLLGIFTLIGSFRLRLGPQTSAAFWGIGPLGYTRRFSTSSVTEILLVKGEALANSPNQKQTAAERSRLNGISCILMAAGRRIPVTSGATESDSRTVAGLLRYCLHDLGYRLQDE